MHGRRIFIFGACALSGLAGLTYEVIWLRLFAVQLGNAAFASATILAAVMGGMGVGALAVSRDTLPIRPLRLYGLIEVTLGLLALSVPW